jgi:3-oxoacyl-[acyl-carrier protein] reductase
LALADAAAVGVTKNEYTFHIDLLIEFLFHIAVERGGADALRATVRDSIRSRKTGGDAMANAAATRTQDAGAANLAGRIAVVTGGSQGLGEAIARLFAERGAAGLVICGRNGANGERVAAEISAQGCPAHFVRADLAEIAQCRAVVAEADRRFGRVDVLVNAAALTDRGDIFDTTEERYNEIMDVNVRAPFFLIQQLLPTLCKGSSIIFTSSLAARASVGTLSAYGATKGAVDTLVKHLAAALGPRGIRVNAVAPGVVESDMSNFVKTEAGREVALGMQALKRVAQPDDIAPVVAFLASDDARWITGDSIHVDGGSKL